MHPHHFTLSLFKHVLGKTEHTLFPVDRLVEMQKEYERLAADQTATQEQIEATAIRFGKESWPYQEGLEELYRRHGKALEEQRVKEKLSAEVRQKYEQFLAAGGVLADFRRGSDTEVYFTADEKYEIGQAVLEAHTITLQEIASSCRADKKNECQEVIDDHRQKLERMEKKILILKSLAGISEKWRPEIEDKIKTFEEAFGYFERTFHESDLDGTIDYYQGVIESPEYG